MSSINSTPLKIGVLGLGRMGAAMAERLLDGGHSLTVWNRSADKAAALVARGAVLATSPADVAAASEIVISMLTDAAAIETIYAGEGGVLSLGPALSGKLFIEMSTVRPQTEIALATRLAAHGAALVESPVGGTVTPARNGKLFGFVGGAEADVARARPLLEQLCRRIEHVGPVGAGSSLKLAINLPLLVYWQALGEALALAAPIGLAPERLMDILADTSGAPKVLELRAPAIVSALKGVSPGAAHFNIDSIRKDLRTMQEEARALGYELPTASATLASFNAASGDGLGNGDGTELAAWWLAHARQG
jgi:3-hydroxyisobutyrate dehydrogenase